MRTLITILALTLSYIVAGSPEDAGLYVPNLDGSVTLTGATAGSWRWMDSADQEYSTAYQDSYSYSGANVTITFNTTGYDLIGHLSATGLKPNFTYQLKLLGFSGTTSNELIGYHGRWWQEEWSGFSWVNGHNLNTKGDGSSPNPNDTTYDTNKVILDATSPTGYKYKHTAYRVFDYFITNADGAAELDFAVNNSYHVLFKESQLTQTIDDGPVLSHTFSVNTSTDTAYSSNFPNTTVGIFGEWERLPLNTITLLAGGYNCQFVLTEESFHGNFYSNPAVGEWALAMYGDVAFTIWAGAAEPDIAVTPTSPSFPNTAVNTTSERTFTITNNGTEDLLLLGTEPVTFIGDDVGLFSVIAQPPSMVPSGSTVQYTVNYTPNFAGTHAVTMRITTNDPDTPTYDVILMGYGYVVDDDESFIEKIEDHVSCGVLPDNSGGLPYYAMLMVMVGVCLYHRRTSIAK